MASTAITPNNREIIAAQSTVTGDAEYLTSTNGALNVNASISGSTQYQEGATTSPGTGTLAIARYDATPPSLSDGELYGLQLDSSGNLKVSGSISVGGTTDNSAFTAGTSTGTPAFGFYHSTIDTVTDGRAAAVAITSKRAQHITPFNSSGTEIGTASTPMQVSLANTATNATAVKVDGTGGTFPVSGTVTVSQATASSLNAQVVGNAASGASDSGNPVKVGGKYNASPITLSDGQRGDLQLTTNGWLQVNLATLISGEDQTANVLGTIMKPVVSSTYAPSTYQQSGSATKANIKAASGNVYYIRITNANTAVRYFQLHNKASAPAGGDTAQLYFIVPGGNAANPGVLELNTNDFAASEYFTTGIGWAISTTATTFTDSATAADHNTTVRYA